MSEITLLDDVEVKLIRSNASDDHVVQAAQVSVLGENNPETDLPRLINYLMEFRHGSPFEHTSFTFFVKAPIFVFREFHRHRIASYNEMSGRYTELLPEFYLPSVDRPLRNTGGSARPVFEESTNVQTKLVQRLVPFSYRVSWKVYKTLLRFGVANEVARIVLPVGIFSQMYVTMNARSLMNFLSLRVGNQPATYVTRPQREIEMVAEKLEAEFAKLMPSTYATFVKNGRVAP